MATLGFNYIVTLPLIYHGVLGSCIQTLEDIQRLVCGLVMLVGPGLGVGACGERVSCARVSELSGASLVPVCGLVYAVW